MSPLNDPPDTPGSTASRGITVQEILDVKREALSLELLDPEVSLTAVALDADITSPGLALAGYTARVPDGRMWVFGETEMTYLGTLDPAEGRLRVATLFGFAVPAVFVTKGQVVPDFFLSAAREHGVPVIRTALSTKSFYRRLKPFLEITLAPTTTLHGSLADVFGVGLLFVGESGVGKSECVLDLVERGHRLVADDVVIASRQGSGILIGRGHELQHHHMEIRGVGIIDIPALFGVRAIRQQKRIEVVVQLEFWHSQRAYARTGLEEDEVEILEVKIPRVTVPLNPGKNITVISEVVAMNHLLKYAGVNSAEAFDRALREYMRPAREYVHPVSEYLEQDHE